MAIAACLTPWRGEILDMFAGIGGVQQATVFGSERRPLLYAAMLNAYQIHGQEFDWCTSEQSPRQGAALWNAVFAVETVDDVRAPPGEDDDTRLDAVRR
jgi:hypothetical protein